MKIQSKKIIILGFIVTAVIFLLVAFIGINGINVINEDVDELGSKYWPAANSAMEIRIVLLEKGYNHALVIEGEIDKTRAEFQKGNAIFDEKLKRIQKSPMSEKAFKNLEEIFLNKKLEIGG